MKEKCYKSFWELKNHYWNHSYWTPVKCKLCNPEHELADCDFLIANHFNSRHSQDIHDSKNENIRKLIGNKFKDDFSPEEKKALLDEEFIQYNLYKGLDQHIEQSLQKVVKEHEEYLRDNSVARIDGRFERLPVYMPTVSVKRLPRIDFDDEDAVFKYVNKTNRSRSPKASTSGIQPQRSPEIFVVGSDSWDTSDEEELLPISARKSDTKKSESTRPRFLESDPSDNESQTVRDRVETNYSSDSNDIEILEENIRYLQCSVCKEVFDNKRNIQQHFKEKHKTAVCGFTYLT